MLKAAAMQTTQQPGPRSAPDRQAVLVRLLSAEETRGHAAQIHVRVELEAGGQSLSSEVDETGSQAVALRAAANATLAALQQAISTDIWLIGVKRIRVFDTNLVIAAIGQRDNSNEPHIGTALVRDNAARAVALAVMDAVRAPS